MQTVVLFATKSGATAECAALLAQNLNCAAYDLTKPLPEIETYDTIIMGSGVRMGKIYKPALGFIRRNLNLLLARRTALYFCNAYPDTFKKAVEKNIPAKLVKQAVCIQSFGGRPPLSSAPLSSWLNQSKLALFLKTIQDISQ